MVSSPAGIPRTAEPVRIILPNNNPAVEGGFRIMNTSGSGRTSSWAPSPIKVQPRIFLCASSRFNLAHNRGNTTMMERRNMIYGSTICRKGRNMVKRTNIMTIPIVRAKLHAIAVIVFFVMFM